MPSALYASDKNSCYQTRAEKCMIVAGNFGRDCLGA